MSTRINKTNDLLTFFSLSEKLKSTTRHSWTSNIKRQESSAEHTWHLTLMAIVLHPYLQNPVDLTKSLKMLIIHDLGEALTGDIPAFIKSPNKHQLEKKAFSKITKSLTKHTRDEIISLWKEFEERKSSEAVFAKMLDVIDVLNQHLIADISTWSEIEFEFNADLASEKYFLHESLLHQMYLELNKRLKQKIADYKKCLV